MPIKSELRPYFKFDNDVPTAKGDLLRHITCNDVITPKFLSKLEKRREKRLGGVGLTVGSGGAISLLPKLNLDGLIFVDINPAVLGFSQFVIDCIATAQTPEHAREMIIHDLPQGLHEVEEDSDKEKVPTLHTVVANKLDAEKRYFGDTHWSNSEVFPRVQDALTDTTIAYANRSITSGSFHLELARVLRQTEQGLTYVNFSNVHHWLASTKSLLGLAPEIGPDTTIQYSVHPEENGACFNLEAKIAKSFPRYLDLANREIKHLGKKSATGRRLPRWNSQP